MNRHVDITFDCLPLRTISRFDIPIDASPKYRARCERILRALERHGSFNSYFLYNAEYTIRLTNSDDVGMLSFRFEGTVLTDETDQSTASCDLEVELIRETCDWLTTPVVNWFMETVPRGVAVEFDRYIAAGDLEQALKRLQRIQSEVEKGGGYVGMYL